MKKRGIVSVFVFTMSILSLILLLLWLFFYYTTKRAFAVNMASQAQTISDSITEQVEKELLSINDTAYSLAHYDRVIAMMSTETTGEFYEKGRLAATRAASIIGNYNPADNVIVFSTNGMFYRLKGQMPNTAAKRIFYLVSENDRIITVAVDGTTYIGCSEEIDTGAAGCGYVVILMEESRLNELISSFNDIGYIGVAISADDEILSSNYDIEYEELKQLSDKSVFYRERAIGLTGFRLHIYCTDTVPERLERYLRIALPIAVIIMLVVIGLFIRYLRNHIVEPVNKIIKNTVEAPYSPLPVTGEEYFDDLVEHINDTLERIEERDRKLYESDMKIKESELAAERTLMSLLKKQISAHFTVNTLNVIRALINKGDKQTAAGICDKLSELLRYANAGDEYISLMEEYHVLEQYVSIMQIRYPDTMTFSVESDDAADEYHIPRMLLQPIVENAIIHGLAGKKGAVSINAEVDGDLYITIRDDGRGMSREKLMELRSKLDSGDELTQTDLKHIALVNVEKRIKLVCGQEYGLSVESLEGEGTDVTVRLPVRKQ